MNVLARIVSENQSLLLLEWVVEKSVIRGFADRSMISKNEDNLNFVTLHNPDETIPYGVKWSQLIEQSVQPIDPVEFENMLHSANVWTIEDFKKNQKFFEIAFLRASGQTISDFMNRLMMEENSHG